MAIFHFSAKMVSRAKGQSAVAKAAYNARDQLTNDQTGEHHDYSRGSGLTFEGIFAPKNAPAWAKDREKLWSEVEGAEKRKDAQLARSIDIALPHELTEEQRRQLVTDFVRENFARKGMVADVAIHAPCKEGDERNHHAHILLTTREIGPDGFGKKVRDWNSREQMETWRENWARMANRSLERHGHEARIDHRSLEAQGINREPTTHKGPTATQMEREGEASERGDINRAIETRNQERGRLREETLEIDREIEAIREQDGKEATPETTKDRPVENAIHKTTDVMEKTLDASLDFFLGAPPKAMKAPAKQKTEELEDKRAHTGQKYQQVKAEREALREKLGLTRGSKGRGRSRDDDEGGRDRERERE